MKKNLFLLFSAYLFVIQPIIISILRNQFTFFWLGIINLVAIILISILYAMIEGTSEGEKSSLEKKLIHEPKAIFQEHFRVLNKERKKTKELLMPSVISFLIIIVMFFIFQHNNTSLELIFLFSVCLGFIVFISLTLIFKDRITKSFRGLIGTKIYIVLLIFGLIGTVYNYYTTYITHKITISEYLTQKFFGENILLTTGYVYTGVGTILHSGTNENVETGNISLDIFSGLIEDAHYPEQTGSIFETGQVLETSLDTATSSDTIIPTSTGKQKIMDAVVYLVRKYKLPLITTPNVKFTYVTPKNPYYPERRTAYAYKMIGKDTNPSKYILCESYIVMKGLAEGWKVSYTATNVISQFWNEAIKRNALNGCKKGSIVDVKNL